MRVLRVAEEQASGTVVITTVDEGCAIYDAAATELGLGNYLGNLKPIRIYDLFDA